MFKTSWSNEFSLSLVLLLLQGKADSMAINNDDDNDGAGSPLFTFVDENIFKKETFLGKLPKSLLFDLISRQKRALAWLFSWMDDALPPLTHVTSSHFTFLRTCLPV